jgi:hypothetical protein
MDLSRGLGDVYKRQDYDITDIIVNIKHNILNIG